MRKSELKEIIMECIIELDEGSNWTPRKTSADKPAKSKWTPRKTSSKNGKAKASPSKTRNGSPNWKPRSTSVDQGPSKWEPKKR